MGHDYSNFNLCCFDSLTDTDDLVLCPVSLVVALRNATCVVLASEGRASHGVQILRNKQRKIYRLGRYCGVGFTGDIILAEAIREKTQEVLSRSSVPDEQRYLEDCSSSVQAVARQVYSEATSHNLLKSEKSGVDILLAGYERKYGTRPVIRILTAKTNFILSFYQGEEPLAIGIPAIATSVFHRLYKSDATSIELARLAVHAIRETSVWYPSAVGGRISVAIITAPPGVGYEEVPVGRFSLGLADFNRGVRSLFYRASR